MKYRRITALLLALMLVTGMLPAALAAASGECRATGGAHNWGSWQVIEQATCAKKGTEYRQCSACGLTERRETDKLPHSWGSWRTTKQATCTVSGEQERTCKVCGKKDTRKTDKLPHTWGEWTVITEPTDHSSGTRTHTCQVCGTTETVDYDPEGTLRRGDRGDAVKELQAGLICYGALTGKADGSYGPGTESAVAKVQAAEGLEPDGVAWPQTQGFLHHLFGEWEVLSEMTDFSRGLKRRVCQRCGYVETVEEWPEPTYKRGDRGDGVRALQEALNAAGYKCGTPDGDFGGRTESAVSKVESANGVQADGIAWPGVQALLGMRSGVLPPEDAGSLTLTLAQTSAPQPEYRHGDTIAVHWTLTNTGAVDLTYTGDLTYAVKAESYDESSPSYGQSDKIDGEQNTTLRPGDSVGGDFTWYILRLTAVDGVCSIYAQARAYPAQGNGSIRSNMPSLSVPFTEEEKPAVKLALKVTPKQDATQFETFDSLDFDVVVENQGSEDLNHIEVQAYDGQDGQREAYVAYSLLSGQSKPFQDHYTFTEADAAQGTVTLRWTVSAETADHAPVTADPVELTYTVVPKAMPVGKYPEVMLSVTPDTDRTAFEEGETVNFHIVLSTDSDEDMTAANVFTFGPRDEGRVGFHNDTLPAHGQREFDDHYTFTARDAQDGAVKLLWRGEAVWRGTHGLGAEPVELNYTVTAKGATVPEPEPEPEPEPVPEPVPVPEPEPEPAYEPDFDLIVTPYTSQTVFYVGDTIELRPVLYNNSDEPMTDGIVWCYDPHGSIYAHYEEAVLPANDYDPFYDTYQFREYDIGEVELQWLGEAVDITGEKLTAGPEKLRFTVLSEEDRPGEGPKAPEDPNATQDGGVVVTKSVENLPARGFFKAGEIVDFAITVENHTGDAITEVSVLDPLWDAPDHIAGETASIPDGESWTVHVYYTVTALDVQHGGVTNVALVNYVGPNGSAEWPSNEAFAPTGREGGGVVVTKSVENLPARGFFVQDEVVDFRITVENHTDDDLTEVAIYDPLCMYAGGILDNFPLIEAGVGTATTHLYYTVTAMDVGSVIYNQAFARFTAANEAKSVPSNVAEAPTGVLTDELTPPVTVEPEPTPAPWPICCVRTLVGVGDGEADFTLDYCEEHAPVNEAVKELLETAETPDEQVSAWEQSVALWREALDSEYDALMAGLGEDEQAVVMDERVSFFLRLACEQDALERRYPDDPLAVLARVSEALMNKTADLCYEAHTAPEARVDSFTIGDYDVMAAMEGYDECARLVAGTDTGAFYWEVLCERHRAAEAAMKGLLDAATDANEIAQAWLGARQLWQMELNALTNVRYLEADEAGREAIAVEKAAFGDWLRAREAFLGLLYPDDPATVNEVVALAIRARVLDLCGEA